MSVVSYVRLETEVLELYDPPLRRRATRTKMAQALREFGAVPGVKKTSDITPGLIARWLKAHTGRAAMTNLSLLRTFRRACNYAKAMHYLRVSPWDVQKDWILFDGSETRQPKHFTFDEVIGFLEQLDADALTGGWHAWRDQAAGYLYAFTGLRNAEGRGLRLADVSLEHRVIRVCSNSGRKLKTGKKGERIIPMPDELADVLTLWIPRSQPDRSRKRPGRPPREPAHDDGPWLLPAPSGIGFWRESSSACRVLTHLRAVAKRAGIGYFAIQMMRRSIATHGRRMGLNKAEVAELLGHTSIATQEQWYLMQCADDARERASRIRYRPAEVGPSPSAN